LLGLQFEPELFLQRGKERRAFKTCRELACSGRWCAVPLKRQLEIVISLQPGLIHHHALPDAGHPGESPGKIRHGFVFENEVAAPWLGPARAGGGPRGCDVALRWVALVEFWPALSNGQRIDRDLFGLPTDD